MRSILARVDTRASGARLEKGSKTSLDPHLWILQGRAGAPHHASLDHPPSCFPSSSPIRSTAPWSTTCAHRSASATGTGSGKTECFLYPLLDHCERDAQAGRRRGIQAIILYPMNALASDQAERIAKELWNNPLPDVDLEPGEERDWRVTAAREAGEELAPLRLGGDFDVERLRIAVQSGPRPSRSACGKMTKYRAEYFLLKFLRDPRELLETLPKADFRLVPGSTLAHDQDVSHPVRFVLGARGRGAASLAALVDRGPRAKRRSVVRPPPAATSYDWRRPTTDSLVLTLPAPAAHDAAREPVSIPRHRRPGAGHDPHKVDGLARALEDVAQRRQVIVWTHDARLFEAVRRLQIRATAIRVDRRPALWSSSSWTSTRWSGTSRIRCA